ncbi:hypothetical protein G17_00060 [Escherichia phage vB_EcoM_G17]|uniref:Uncharacterized protein n=1 Tax=Escherichia phage 121Q TaxID=1555202 RepID=A0A097EXG5_9CAUD|nr:hypothetical protein PBI_121Q_257 [Escherichia phage 121Q]AIT14147.1 hypothetical protein PBI_121Q_257 [Escherichia phage 121Q]QBO61556.1 hypothetical protein G17_00060 [Escherichia phage vB_EcoM_G17]
MYKEYYISKLPVQQKYFAAYKVLLITRAARSNYMNSVKRAIENDDAMNQYYNILLLIYKY